MKKSLIILIVFTFQVIFISFNFQPVQNSLSAPEPIKIGVFIQETGSLTIYTPWVKQGFELGLIYSTGNTNQTDAGRPYEIHYYDTTGVGSAVTAIATDAIETDGIDILVGGISSSVAPYIMQVAANYGLLYFAGPAADTEITGSLFDKHTFRVARNSYQDAKAGIYHSMEVVGAEKIAFLAADHPFGYTGVASMTSEIVKRGGQVVATEYVPFGTTDFSSYLSNLNTEATTGRIDMLHIVWAGSFANLWADIATYNVGANMNISGVPIDILSMNSLEASLKPLGTTIVGMQGACVYGYELPNNPVNDWMVQEHINRNVTPNGWLGLNYRVPELFTASSFGSAQFLVNVTNTIADLQIDNMITHLEGLNITTPKGSTHLRPTDHQGLAEMYIADIVNDTDPTSETYNMIIAKLNQTIPASECAPPVTTSYVPYPKTTTTITGTTTTYTETTTEYPTTTTIEYTTTTTIEYTTTTISQLPKAPGINHPDDIAYQVGTTDHHIRWFTDDDNPTTYSVTRNGEVVQTGIYQSSSYITINVDGLSVGSYDYEITVNDADNHSVMDQVVVTVIEEETTSTDQTSPSSVTRPSTPTSPTTPSLTPGIDAVLLLIGLITIYFYRRKYY